jgi:hypothetical protein
MNSNLYRYALVAKVQARDWPALRAADQLTREVRRGAALHGGALHVESS